jgi:glycosyltransferase involved in cell wall biosynthesis
MSKDKLRIFGAVNHLGNQYEMLKLAEHYDVEFTYLENNVRKWSKYSPRPMPKHLKWATYYEPGKYDLAILHTDQQHADPAIGKGQLYRQMNEVIQDIPKIVINHGTPMWDEQFTEEVVINGGDIIDRKGKPKRIDGIKKIIGDNFMVVNSYHAVKRWGWGYPLIHGFDPNEWWDLPKEPRVSLQVSPAGLDKYYNRQLLTHIKTYTKEKVGMLPMHISVDVKPQDWDEYRELLATSLLFISQQFDSPMSRSRTEAMLSGACVLSSRHDDAELFIENGINGFLIPDNPISYAETINQLLNHNYRATIEIGQRGKQTAIKYFNTERYLSDLWHIVTEVSKGNKPEWNGETIYGKRIDDKGNMQNVPGGVL